MNVFGDPFVWIKLCRTTLGGARALGKRTWRQKTHNARVNLPGEPLYGFGCLCIPLDDVWIFSAMIGFATCQSLNTEPTSPTFSLEIVNIHAQGRLHWWNERGQLWLTGCSRESEPHAWTDSGEITNGVSERAQGSPRALKIRGLTTEDTKKWIRCSVTYFLITPTSRPLNICAMTFVVLGIHLLRPWGKTYRFCFWVLKIKWCIWSYVSQLNPLWEHDSWYWMAFFIAACYAHVPSQPFWVISLTSTSLWQSWC